MKQTSIEVIRGINSSKMEDLTFMMNHSIQENQNIINDLAISENRTNEISEEIIELGEVKKLLIQLKNSKMIDKKDFILNTINMALSDVFIDQNVKIDLVAANTNQESSKLNIKYDIVLYQNGLEMARNEKLLLKNGGGVLSFISILFKILVGFIYSKNKFYIFDESLAEVSELYRPRMAQFIQKFCEKHDFTIIIITQTSDIAEYADLVYKLDGEFDEGGIPTLKIETVEGEYPTENYIYSKIENFQSIKKLEFRYKGFTAIIGKNNIGKSASFRAVNSIIFNNFDMKEFPRMTSATHPDKLLPSKIEFGKFTVAGDPQNDINKISMYKKGASLIYEFNGDTFVGKNLAFEKVKEKIEDIGFKYLNLKEQYKNFKGNLKEQTERLAITTQQDTYYLIGAKTSDTSKVFDFLFDSREVTLAIINLNNDILLLEQELNNLSNKKALATNTFKFNESKIKLLRNKYKIILIEKIYSHETELNELEELQSVYNSINLNCKSLLELSTFIYSINYNNTKVQELLKSQVKKSKIIDLTNKIIMNITNINLIKNIKNSWYHVNWYNKKISIIKNILSQNCINLLKCNYSSIELLKKKELSLHRLYNISNKLIDNIQKSKFIELLMIEHDRKNSAEKRIDKLIKRSDVLLNLIKKIENIFSIKNTINNYNELVSYFTNTNKVEKIKQKEISWYQVSINILNNKILLNNIDTTRRNLNYLEDTLNNKKEEIKKLPAKFGLDECRTCNGGGYHLH